MSAWGNYVPTGMWPQQQQATAQPDATLMDNLMGQSWMYSAQWTPAYYGAHPYAQPTTPPGYHAHPPYPPQPQPGGQSYPPQPRIVPPRGESHPKLGLEARAGEADEDVDWEDSGDEEANVEADHEDDNHAMQVYCKECQTWLNGPRQWEDHKIGKKHRKNVQKAKRGTAGGSSEVAHPERKEPPPEEVPEKKTEALDWLENAKTQKDEDTQAYWKEVEARQEQSIYWNWLQQEKQEKEKQHKEGDPLEGDPLEETPQKTSRNARRRRRNGLKRLEIKAKQDAANNHDDLVDSKPSSKILQPNANVVEKKDLTKDLTDTRPAALLQSQTQAPRDALADASLTESSERPADVVEKKDLTIQLIDTRPATLVQMERQAPRDALRGKRILVPGTSASPGTMVFDGMLLEGSINDDPEQKQDLQKTQERRSRPAEKRATCKTRSADDLPRGLVFRNAWRHKPLSFELNHNSIIKALNVDSRVLTKL